MPAQRFDPTDSQFAAHLFPLFIARRAQPYLILVDSPTDQVQIVQIGDDDDLLLLDGRKVVVDAADHEVGAHTDPRFQNYPQIEAVADA